MELFVATSRGRELEPYYREENMEFWFKGGSRLSGLEAKANQMLMRYHHEYPNIVYFIGGIPDITIKIKDDPNYAEVVFTEDTTDAFNRICQRYIDISNNIRNNHAIPCFATITPMNIDTWNHYCLNQGFTSHLIHHNHYEDMTSLLNMTIVHLNSFIRDLNDFNNVETPRLGHYSYKKRGANREPRYLWYTLRDGCHPTPETVELWKMELDLVVKTNRQRHPAHHHF